MHETHKPYGPTTASSFCASALLTFPCSRTCSIRPISVRASTIPSFFSASKASIACFSAGYHAACAGEQNVAHRHHALPGPCPLPRVGGARDRGGDIPTAGASVRRGTALHFDDLPALLDTDKRLLKSDHRLFAVTTVPANQRINTSSLPAPKVEDVQFP